jgi:hypothetical protein
LLLAVFSLLGLGVMFSWIVFFYNTIFLWLVHTKLNRAVISYFITKIILFVLLNHSTYVLEKNLFLEFSSKLKLEEDKNYYYNILDTMSIGLFAFKKESYFYNKFIKVLSYNIFDGVKKSESFGSLNSSNNGNKIF